MEFQLICMFRVADRWWRRIPFPCCYFRYFPSSLLVGALVQCTTVAHLATEELMYEDADLRNLMMEY